MTFNANDYVFVKLTDRGRKILKENHEKLFAGPKATLYPYREPETCAEFSGYCKFQLWELMREFGPYLYNGCEVPFETEMKMTSKVG
jgi:hypothetical protein